MASVHEQIEIAARPDDVWDALRDWGAIDRRLVPGFVTECRLDGEDRILTFFNGAVARERLVDCDEQAHRLAWSIVEGPYAHHNASAQVFAADDGRAHFVWIADVLPHALGEPTRAMMRQGLQTLKQTLESAQR